jgi:hypothetical protein
VKWFGTPARKDKVKVIIDGVKMACNCWTTTRGLQFGIRVDTMSKLVESGTRYVTEASRGYLVITCPECKAQTNVPIDTVEVTFQNVS